MFAVTSSPIAGFCKRIPCENFNFTKSYWEVRRAEGGVSNGCVPLPTCILLCNWADYLCWWRSDRQRLLTSTPLETPQNWSLYLYLPLCLLVKGNFQFYFSRFYKYVFFFYMLIHVRKYVLSSRQRNKCVEINKQWQEVFCSCSLFKAVDSWHLSCFPYMGVLTPKALFHEWQS
jgi:hypothetical protein